MSNCPSVSGLATSRSDASAHKNAVASPKEEGGKDYVAVRLTLMSLFGNK